MKIDLSKKGIEFLDFLIDQEITDSEKTLREWENSKILNTNKENNEIVKRVLKNKIKFMNTLKSKLIIEDNKNEIICERCGLPKYYKGLSIDVRYYEYAKQTLCDCCIDIFNGNSWGYNRLKELFGDEQAKKMLTSGFNEVPFGFKITTGLPLFLGKENDLKNITELANELNSQLKKENSDEKVMQKALKLLVLEKEITRSKDI